MHVLKIVVAAIATAIFGFIVYVFVIEPAMWYPNTRRASIRVLKAVRSTSDFTNAVGYYGLFMALTNNQWIVIRYRDSHAGGVFSCAVARDSSGGWFESNRHFCGSLRYWPQFKEEVAADEEKRRAYPEFYLTNKDLVARADWPTGMFPTYGEMIAIESAPDLESARRALRNIGFKDLRQ